MGFGRDFFGAATEALPLGAKIGVRGIEYAQKKKVDARYEKIFQMKLEDDKVNIFIKALAKETDPNATNNLIDQWRDQELSQREEEMTKGIMTFNSHQLKKFDEYNDIIKNASSGNGKNSFAEGAQAQMGRKALFRANKIEPPAEYAFWDKFFGVNDAALNEKNVLRIKNEGDIKAKAGALHIKGIAQGNLEAYMKTYTSDGSTAKAKKEAKSFIDSSVSAFRSASAGAGDERNTIDINLKELFKKYEIPLKGFTTGLKSAAILEEETAAAVDLYSRKQGAKGRQLSQDLVDVLAGNQFNVKPEDATPEQIDAAGKIVFNNKLQLEKEKFTELQLEKAKGKLSPNVVSQLVDPNGNRALLGLTLEEAILGEYVPVTSEDKKEAKQAKTVDAALNAIEKAITAVFKDTTRLNRYPIKVLQNSYSVFFLNEQGRAIRKYEALKESLMAGIGKAVGEGRFTDEDRDAVRKAFPRVFPVPDTKVLADELIKQLRDTVANMLARPRTAAGTGKGGSGQVEGFDVKTAKGLLGYVSTKKDKKKDEN